MEDWEKKIDMMAEAAMNEDVRMVVGVPSWTLVLIKRIMEIKGKEKITDIWPDLELFLHGGVSFKPYRKQFESIIDSPKMNYLETYNASEGFFGIQDRLGSEDMLLMLDYGIYYEFIPMENVNDAQPKTLSLNEVEVGEVYAIVISTNGGLWRYMIGDTIQFTSLHPFRIKVSGRTKHFINAFGEEVIIENAIQADYEAKRSFNLALVEPLVKSVPKGTFYQWMKARGKLGGQNKVPRLANNRKYLDEIDDFMSAGVLAKELIQI